MKIVERENIDADKWDALVRCTSGASLFSLSWYLDAVAENWCALIDEDYSIGIALPFTKRLSFDLLYTPIFITCLEVIGKKTDFKKFEDKIKERFIFIDYSVKERVLGVPTETFVYQLIEKNKKNELNSQAKRSVQKALKNNLRIEESDSYEEIFSIVRQELNGKFTGINNQSLMRLEKLFDQGRKNNKLITFKIMDGHECKGGIVCLKDESDLLYIKGAATDSCKKKGGMYLAIHSAIENSKENNIRFDFGGSRVNGVRNFNLNLGGKDHFFYHYAIDNTPWWFKMLRRTRDIFRNK